MKTEQKTIYIVAHYGNWEYGGFNNTYAFENVDNALKEFNTLVATAKDLFETSVGCENVLCEKKPNKVTFYEQGGYDSCHQIFELKKITLE